MTGEDSHLRERLEDLKATLSVSNNNWNAWELEFIEDICQKLSQPKITMSLKQYDLVCSLWDRI